MPFNSMTVPHLLFQCKSNRFSFLKTNKSQLILQTVFEQNRGMKKDRAAESSFASAVRTFLKSKDPETASSHRHPLPPDKEKPRLCFRGVSVPGSSSGFTSAHSR